MRQIAITAVCVIISLAFTACDLNEKIYGTIDDSSFWKTEKDFREGLNYAYGTLNTPYNGFSIWQYVIEDGGADYNASGAPYGDFYNYTNWSSTNPDGIDWGIYQYFWKEISYINTTLDKIQDASIDEGAKTRYISEGRCLRAFLYFTLVQWFKEVPLITSSQVMDYTIPQESPETIYAFIEKEFAECQDGLLSKPEMQAAGEQAYTHLTRGAAQALLARTYLVQKKYDECFQACKALITDTERYGTYSLMSNYKQMFRTKGFDNSEVLWALAADGINNVSLLQVYLYKPWDVENPTVKRDTSYDIYYNWNGSIGVSPDFYNSFEVGDSRLECLLYEPQCDKERVMVTKYPAETSDKILSSNDTPIIRWADVLLMYAESALLKSSPDTDTALEQLKEVRKRAGLSPISSGLSPEELKWKIYEERRHELFMEGCGKRDMLRFGTLRDHILSISTDAGNDPERYYYLPIPRTALTANPALHQNSPNYK